MTSVDTKRTNKRAPRHAFYYTGKSETPSETIISRSLEALNLPDDTNYVVVKGNRDVISQKSLKIVFGHFYGCKHPSERDCAVCSGSSSTNFDPFISADEYNLHLSILKESIFETAQEAIDSYTFFNMIWDWNRRRAVHSYFTFHYRLVDEIVLDINLGFNFHLAKKSRYIAEDLPLDPNFRTNDDDTERKAMLPYCSWVHLPKRSNVDSSHYGVHFIDTKLPTRIEVITYLSHMLNPQPDFSEKILSARIHRSNSDSNVTKIRAEFVRTLLPNRRSSSNIPSSSANREEESQSPPPRLSPAIPTAMRRVMLKDATRQTARNRAQDERTREQREADPRPARANRMKKCPPALVSQFERGYPRIILISDNPLLEQRSDLIITPSKRYCNVFSVTTPTSPSARKSTTDNDDDDDGPW